MGFVLAAAGIAAAQPAPRATIDDGDRPRLESILAFRDEHLSVREVRRYVPGSTTVVSQGWGFGPRPYWGWGLQGSTFVTVEPPRTESEWAVFQGIQRLTVPSYLEATDQPLAAEDLVGRIDRARRTSTAFRTIGWAAVVGGVASVLVAAAHDDIGDVRTFTAVGVASTGTGLLSLAIGGAQKSRARSLTFDYDRTRDLSKIQQEVRAYNGELMERLDLTPEQALRELDRSRERSDDAPER